MLKGQYDRLVIFSPTLDINGDYDFLEEDDNTIFKVSSKIFEATNELIQSQTNFFKQVKEGFLEKENVPRVVLIYDDCLNNRVFNDKGPISQFAIKARHYKISIIATTQRIAGISRQFRINCSHCIFFSVMNYSELERIILEQVPQKYKKIVQEKLMDLFKMDYAFIHINNKIRDPLNRFFINGTDPLSLDK